MPSRVYLSPSAHARIVIPLLMLFCSLPFTLRADFSFADFRSTVGLNLVRDAARADNVLRITPASPERGGAAWFATPQTVQGGFRTNFRFQITKPASAPCGADGFAFVIQNSSPNAIGFGGGAIGYGGGGGGGPGGIPNSVAVEFDTWHNPEFGDPNGNHVSVHTRGTRANSSLESDTLGNTGTDLRVTLADGVVHSATINYIPGSMVIYMDDLTTPVLSVRVDLASLMTLSGGAAYVGFTAGNGACGESHDILSWSLTSTSGSGCQLTKLLPVFTSLPSGGALNSGFPVPLEARVVSDCGSPLTIGFVAVSFSNGDPPLSLVSQGSGRWSGAWLPRSPAQAVTLTVTATTDPLGEFGIRATTSVTVTLGANPNTVQVFPGGVVSAASFAAGAPLAPGSLVSLFGRGFSSVITIAAALPLPTDLGGTSVLIGGQLMPLLYVGPDQINGMIPFDAPLGASQGVVRRGSTQSLPEPITMAAAQPAIFTKNQSGSGQGVIVNASGIFAEPVSPVHPGDVIVIYCSGLGAVIPPVAAGSAPPVNPLSTVISPVSLHIGGVPARLLFAGLTPGFAGLYQVNAFVPDLAPSGAGVQVVLAVDSHQSSPVTIAIVMR